MRNYSGIPSDLRRISKYLFKQSRKGSTNRRKVKSKLYKEAQKELKRIQRSISSIEKRGYSFIKLPPKFFGATRYGEEKTKWSRKEVESLRAIKAKDLYKYAVYSTETGEVISGEEGRHLERSIAAKKAAETRKLWYSSERTTMYELKKDIRLERSRSMISDLIISNFLDITKFNPSKLADEVYPKTRDFINSMIAERGKNYVANAIQLAAADGMTEVVQQSYNWNIDFHLSEFASRYFNEDIKIEDNHIDEPDLENNPFDEQFN